MWENKVPKTQVDLAEKKDFRSTTNYSSLSCGLHTNKLQEKYYIINNYNKRPVEDIAIRKGL